ncbi:MULTISPECIES: helix-turn-helix domain-containing protein [Psychrilyobacter]|uniref:Cupin domain-containing protein n=1 Tax=Psychrilyobacter piezotolerans TaxID=2293438 RepID=A0ABX9KIU4_9FUSO|nr:MULTISPECIES: helix-turn-helix domain-containing protein [Psychrilyobacter]MCS5421126.1 cupin domain-containing protein [Psychrilyobacter sp. S5]NDI77102.1 cupin domain-containing protein [Psychrilyobacter piezotolerans]RDE64102.1 cupin domain-containing protein [Psychrilyobacter sp. S5]REI42194.1 cupin domain-containing protein [Psychrilyobacter piezotolerans]
MSNVEQIEFMNKKGQNKGFEIISLKSFFESVDESFIKTPYRTSFYNLIFITGGRGVHEIDFLEYTVKAGDLLMISRNRVHSYSEFNSLEGYLITFTEGFLCEFLSSQTSEVKELFKLSYLNPHVNCLDLYTTTLTTLLNVINDMYKNAYEFLDNKVIASAFNTFMQILSNSRLGENLSKYKKNETFVQFTELVEKNINSVKTVKEYADMMYVSKKTVNLMTRKAIDMSAKQYIIQQLILKIRLKLSFEQKSINEIAYELGFTEPSNMTRFFKKNTKISPSEFRNIIRHDKNSWLNSESMELNSLRESIEENVYHISSEAVVPLHKHEDLDEIFYCIKGSGFGVLENGEVKLNVGDTFIAPAGIMHSLRSDGDLYVAAFLIRVVDERKFD